VLVGFHAFPVSDVQWRGAAVQNSPDSCGGKRHVPGPEEENRRHGMEIEVVQDEECIELMRDFIREKPELWHEDIAV
jgi:hypothetical protein